MKKTSLKVATYLLTGILLCGTSSCTSKSDNVSTQTQTPVALPVYDDPLENLIKGNERFVSGKMVHVHQDSVRVKDLIEGQHPHSVIISCSDSRATPEIIFDQGLGDLFTIRTAGNVMSSYEEGSVEYAVEHAHAKLVVVMGHTECGAIGALLSAKDGAEHPGHIAAIVDALSEEIEEKEAMEKGGEQLPFEAVKANVIHGVKQLRESEPILKEMYDAGKIKIVGAIYNLESGKVEFLDI